MTNGPKGGLDPRAFLLLGLLDEEDNRSGQDNSPFDDTAVPITVFVLVAGFLFLAYIVAVAVYSNLHPYDPAPWWFP